MNNYPDGFTQTMHDEMSSSDEPHATCTACSADIAEDQTKVVELFRTAGNNIYFCNDACRSNHIYDQANNASAKAELRKLVAALQLLCSIQLMRAPTLEEFGGDSTTYRKDGLIGRYRTVELDDMISDARSFLGMLSPDDSATWTNGAVEAADDFAFALKRRTN